MYMDALESEVESLSSEVTRLRLMLHRVTQVMEAPPMAEPAYNTATAASTGHPSSFAHPMPTFHRPPPQHTDPMNQVQQLLELIKQAGSSDVLRQLLSLEKSNEMGDSTDSHPTRMGASYKVDRRRTKAPPLNDVDLATEDVGELKGRSSFSADEVHSGTRHPYSGKPPQAAGKGQQPFVDNLGGETTPDQANNNNDNTNNKRSSDAMYLSKTPGMWSFPTPMMADRGEGSTLASPNKEGHAPKKEASSSPPTAAAATAKRLSVAERLQQLKDEPSSSYKLDDSALPPAAAGRLGAKATIDTRNIEDSQQSTESMVMPSMNTTESVIGKPYQTPKSSLPQAAAAAAAAPAVSPNGNDTSSVSFSFSHCVPGGTGRKDDDMPQANTLAEPPTTTASPTMPPSAVNTTKLVPAQTSVLSHNSSEEEDPNVPIMGQGQEAVILGARKSIGYGGGGSPPLGPSGARPSSAVDTSPNLTPTKGMRTQAQPRESILDRLRRHTVGYDTSEEDEEEDDDNDDDVGAEPREHTQAHHHVEDNQMEEDGGEGEGEGYDDAQGSNRAGSASQSGVNANSPERMHYTPVNASRNENGYSYGTLDAYSLGWHSPSRGASPQQPAIESNHNNNGAHASPSAAKSVSARSVADYDWGIASSHAAGPSVKSSHSELPSTGYYDF